MNHVGELVIQVNETWELFLSYIKFNPKWNNSIHVDLKDQNPRKQLSEKILMFSWTIIYLRYGTKTSDNVSKNKQVGPYQTLKYQQRVGKSQCSKNIHISKLYS